VPVSRHREAVPRALEAVVMRCLEKNPADRWQSAGELLPQVEALMTPSGGVTPTQTRPVAGVRRPHPVRSAAMVVAAAVVIGAAGVIWWNARARLRPELTRLQLTSSGTAEMPVISPDGSQVAYVARRCTPREGCSVDLVVRDLATEAEQPILRDGRWITPLRYSPDGARILFNGSLSGEGEGAFLIPRIGGAPQRLFAASDSLRGLDFLPGGDTVLAHLGGRLRSVLVAGGQVTETVQLPAGFTATLRGVSADGRWMTLERPRTYWGATTLLLADRGGRIVDSLTTPVVFGSARWNGSRALLAVEGAPYVGLEHAVLRWSVNRRSGQASGPDTVLVALTRAAPDVAADGRSLVMGGLNAGESELWTLEPTSDMVLRPVRKVVGATGTLWGRMAADGRTLAYVVESGGPWGRGFRVFVEDFDGEHNRPLTPPIPVNEFVDFTISGYGDRIYVATRSGDAATRVMAYEVATGRAQPFVELPPPPLTLWQRPGGGLLWYRDEETPTLHVLDAEGRTIAELPVPSRFDFMVPELSRDATEVVLLSIEPAGGQRGESEVALHALSLADGRERLVARTAAWDFSVPPTWGDDGWIRIEMATPRDPRFVVYRVPATGGSFEPEFVSPFEGPCMCSMSRDGRRWVGVRQGTRSDIVLVRDFDRLRR
jgi:hypothetical protein